MSEMHVHGLANPTAATFSHFQGRIFRLSKRGSAKVKRTRLGSAKILAIAKGAVSDSGSDSDSAPRAKKPAPKKKAAAVPRLKKSTRPAWDKVSSRSPRSSARVHAVHQTY